MDKYKKPTFSLDMTRNSLPYSTTESIVREEKKSNHVPGYAEVSIKKGYRDQAVSRFVVFANNDQGHILK
ncbi:unnamed protein product [Clavelina lepadiformis]|uniref:Uncharacterized protein n=1 Tax=Clavelina lepadiformis TaxID=159417 RepID=A0ABP0GZE0_CLALP